MNLGLSTSHLTRLFLSEGRCQTLMSWWIYVCKRSKSIYWVLLLVQEVQAEIRSFTPRIRAILEAKFSQDLPHQIGLMAVIQDSNFLYLKMPKTGGEIIGQEEDQCHKEMEIAIGLVSTVTLKENAPLTSHACKLQEVVAVVVAGNLMAIIMAIMLGILETEMRKVLVVSFLCIMWMGQFPHLHIQMIGISKMVHPITWHITNNKLIKKRHCKSQSMWQVEMILYTKLHTLG